MILISTLKKASANGLRYPKLHDNARKRKIARPPSTRTLKTFFETLHKFASHMLKKSVGTMRDAIAGSRTAAGREAKPVRHMCIGVGFAGGDEISGGDQLSLSRRPAFGAPPINRRSLACATTERTMCTSSSGVDEEERSLPLEERDDRGKEERC